jgi:hypothetical protein
MISATSFFWASISASAWRRRDSMSAADCLTSTVGDANRGLRGEAIEEAGEEAEGEDEGAVDSRRKEEGVGAGVRVAEEALVGDATVLVRFAAGPGMDEGAVEVAAVLERWLFR